MDKKSRVVEKQARQQLLRYALFTLGGVGLEGSYPQAEKSAPPQGQAAENA